MVSKSDDPYVWEVVAFFTKDGFILCPYCAHRQHNSIAVHLAEEGKKNSEGLHGLNRKVLSEFMLSRFKDDAEFYDDLEFYPCDICGGEIE